MAMDESVLVTELETVLLGSDTEQGAIDAWADAYSEYALDAEALTPILPTGVALGRAAMIPAMVGLSAPGAALAALSAGHRAFWVGVAGGLAMSFAGATAITPPPMLTIETVLSVAFLNNNDPAVTREQAAAELGQAIHSQRGGGTVTTAGPVITPIT